MKKIAILASGSGSNAENIVKYFEDRDDIEVSIIISNKANAFVLERSKILQIPYLYINKEIYENHLVDLLKSLKIDLVVLAGFLWLIPANLVEAFKGKMINVHPALLPKFGGKGMYGMHVHRAVVNAGEKRSGITIHYVNEHFDEGEIVAQFQCELSPNDSADDVAVKIHDLEMEFFPQVIDQLLS